MKKALSFLLTISLAVFLMGCSPKAKLVLNFEGKEVKELKVSTLPESETYERTFTASEEIDKIIDYINGMHLKSNFSENPMEYTGMSVVMEFIFSDNSSLTVYSFGNMFLRVGNAPWLRMEQNEARTLEEMVLPQ